MLTRLLTLCAVLVPLSLTHLHTYTYTHTQVLRKDYAHAADVWSAGVIMFILLSGCELVFGEGGRVEGVRGHGDASGWQWLHGRQHSLLQFGGLEFGPLASIAQKFLLHDHNCLIVGAILY